MEVVLYIVAVLCMLPLDIYTVRMIQDVIVPQCSNDPSCRISDKEMEKFCTSNTPFEGVEDDDDYWCDNGCNCDECRANWWKKNKKDDSDE